MSEQKFQVIAGVARRGHDKALHIIADGEMTVSAQSNMDAIQKVIESEQGPVVQFERFVSSGRFNVMTDELVISAKIVVE